MSFHPHPKALQMRRARLVAAACVGLWGLSACAGQPEQEQEAGPTGLSAQTSPPADVDATTSSPSGDVGAATGAPTSDPSELPPPPVDASSLTGAAQAEVSEDPRLSLVGRYAAEYARAATDSDPDRAEWLATMTEVGQGARGDLIEADLGWEYPGPLPFTITEVIEQDGGAVVQACVMRDGFALQPETGMRSGEILLMPLEFHLVDVDGDYLVDGLYTSDNRCDNVDVEARTW